MTTNASLHHIFRQQTSYMPIRPDTRRLPTLRNILTRIYSDLFTIDDRLRWHDPVDPFLPVEKMIFILEDRRFFRPNWAARRSSLLVSRDREDCIDSTAWWSEYNRYAVRQNCTRLPREDL